MTTSDVPVKGDRPLVGLVSPMGRTNREYLLRQLASRFRVWVFDAVVEDWVGEYATGHTVADPRSAAALVRAGRSVPLDAVLTWDELCSVATAEMAQELGLPGPDPESLRRCRDKYLTRRAMAEHGLRTPISVAVGTLDEALSAARFTRYPAVLKPRTLTGSIGPVLVRSREELVEAFPRVLAARIPGLAVTVRRPLALELYLDGPEISVDCVCFDGEIHPLFLAHKRLGFPPYFEEVGHVLDAEDPLLDDEELLVRLREAHAAVGFDRGWTHSEWRLTDDGAQLVEINPRIGGDLIPQLGTLATGLEPAVLAGTVALGRSPDLRATEKRAAAVRFVYPETGMDLDRVEIDEERLPENVVLARPLAEPGQRLDLPPLAHGTGRGAVVVSVGDRADAAENVLDAAESAIRLVPRPPVGPGGGTP